MTQPRADLHTLVYHRVCAREEWYPSPYVVTEQAFRRHMTYLHEAGFYTPGLTTILRGDSLEGNGGRAPFLLTFDDGYLDNYTRALPLLREFGFTATIFLVADFSRRYNWWDLSNGTPRAELLQRNHIEEMTRYGIEFGSHTVSHPRLPELSDASLRDELARSKSVLEDVVQRPVVSFAYPYSAMTAREKQAVREAGYSCSFAVNGGPRNFWNDLFEIRRMNVRNREGAFGLRAKMNGSAKLLLWTWGRGNALVKHLRPSRTESTAKRHEWNP